MLYDDDFDLEPCSMWTSFMNAALHFSRVTLDLTPFTQVPQYSVPFAAGDHQTGGSVILNTWAPKDQNIGEINSNLQLLRQEDQEALGNESSVPDTWLEQALREATAHIVEPPQDATGSAWRLVGTKKGYGDESTAVLPAPATSTTSTVTTTTSITTTQPRSICKIIFVLADPETGFQGNKNADGDTTMEEEDDADESWFYGGQDIRALLYETVRSMETSIKKRNINIHLDLIRIATSQRHARSDIIMEQISRTCTASVYTVISEDELSPVRALTNYFLLQNSDVKVLRVHDMAFAESSRKEVAEFFHKSDHIGPTAVRKTDSEGEQNTMSILQQTTSSIKNVIDANYARVINHSRARVHLLTDKDPSDSIVTRAILSHAGRVFIHCIPTEFEDGMPKREAELKPVQGKESGPHNNERSRREDSAMPEDSTTSYSSSTVSDIMRRPLVDKTPTPAVLDFIKNIVRPNSVRPKVDWVGGGFVELTPPALKTTAAVQFKAKGGGGGGVKSHARKDQATVGVDMAVVHSTRKLDLETRWLVQWQGERVHPILPEHNVLLEQVRTMICKANVHSTAGIVTVLEKLIADARPTVLPGPIGIPENLPPNQHKIVQQAVQTSQQSQQHQDQSIRESAQAILADLWMVGQRFKSVSPSHAVLAKEIGEMVAPTGVDHNTVKLTYIAPVLRAFQQAKEIDPTIGITNMPDGGSPNPNQGHGQWGGRGGGNIGGGGIRGGRGGMQGGARFGDNNNNRNNANNNNRRGGFGGPGGGIPGGFRNSGGGGGGANAVNPQGSNIASSNTEEILSDPSLPLCSMSGRTQPVPYLETAPPTREEIENGDQAYLSELGEEGSLLRTYWGPRGAQGSSVAAIVNSMTSLDSTTLLEPAGAAPPPPPLIVGPGSGQDLASIHAGKQHQRRLKRPRLQDFAGRTPVKEYGGFSRGS
ncbi:hypothetical protein BGZ95_001599 [Linnemannia exigua]|uniref:Uncharacterized protein n=1 Tax=Linnemannia exigua TaxID=604196 RepID=A0AAD4D730_9FUNG|nr:hypothetical protein BGZ95_001599 [Linnemannia exigua]